MGIISALSTIGIFLGSRSTLSQIITLAVRPFIFLFASTVLLRILNLLDISLILSSRFLSLWVVWGCQATYPVTMFAVTTFFFVNVPSISVYDSSHGV